MITRLLLITYSDETTIFRFSLIEGCTKKVMLSTSLSIQRKQLYQRNHYSANILTKNDVTCPSDWASNFWKRNWHLFIPMEIFFYKLPFQSIQLDDFDSPENQSCCVLRVTPHVVTWKLPKSIKKFTKKADTEAFLFYILQLEKSFINYLSDFILGKMIENSGNKNH